MITYLIIGIIYGVISIVLSVSIPERRELTKTYYRSFSFWMGYVIGLILNVAFWPIAMIFDIINIIDISRKRKD